MKTSKSKELNDALLAWKGYHQSDIRVFYNSKHKSYSLRPLNFSEWKIVRFFQEVTLWWHNEQYKDKEFSGMVLTLFTVPSFKKGKADFSLENILMREEALDVQRAARGCFEYIHMITSDPTKTKEQILQDRILLYDRITAASLNFAFEDNNKKILKIWNRMLQEVTTATIDYDKLKPRDISKDVTRGFIKRVSITGSPDLEVGHPNVLTDYDVFLHRMSSISKEPLDLGESANRPQTPSKRIQRDISDLNGMIGLTDDTTERERLEKIRMERLGELEEAFDKELFDKLEVIYSKKEVHKKLYKLLRLCNQSFDYYALLVDGIRQKGNWMQSHLHSTERVLKATDKEITYTADTGVTIYNGEERIPENEVCKFKIKTTAKYNFDLEQNPEGVTFEISDIEFNADVPQKTRDEVQAIMDEFPAIPPAP